MKKHLSKDKAAYVCAVEKKKAEEAALVSDTLNMQLIRALTKARKQLRAMRKKKANALYPAWDLRAVRSVVKDLRPHLKGKALNKAVTLCEEGFPGQWLDEQVRDDFDNILDENDIPEREA